MTRNDLKEATQYYSEKVSDVTRQLNLAGLGIIWIFRVGGPESGGIPWGNFFLVPMGLMVLSLGCELWQYVHYTYLWDAEYRKCIEAEMPDTEEIPNWDSSKVKRGKRLFYAKVGLTGTAFLMLVAMIGRALAS